VIVDWGDALLSKTYTASSQVRIETVLKQDATIAGVTDTMTAYTMKLLSGSQTTELQGTDKSTYASATRNVFAINARLKIEKISTDGSPDVVVVNKAVYEGFGTTTEVKVVAVRRPPRPMRPSSMSAASWSTATTSRSAR